MPYRDISNSLFHCKLLQRGINFTHTTSGTLISELVLVNLPVFLSRTNNTMFPVCWLDTTTYDSLGSRTKSRGHSPPDETLSISDNSIVFSSTWKTAILLCPRFPV